ncbi:MAG: radical SAM protein, partial [Pseudomonadota bacterium]
ISQSKNPGQEVSAKELAQMMLSLQKQGAHNINFVTPSHVAPQILEALVLAVQGGLSVPLVYNTNGYDDLETLPILEGIINVYLPDLKYFSAENAAQYSGPADYPARAKEAILEMFRQVGEPLLEDEGVLHQGMAVRHLVLPNGLSDTDKVLAWLAKNFGDKIYLSLMSQYFPTHKAPEFSLLSRPLLNKEYQKACDLAFSLGLNRGWFQDLGSQESYRPNFEKETPFGQSDR